MRLAAIVFLLVAAIFSPRDAHASNAGDLVLNGQFTQGSLFRGQVPPDTQVRLDGKLLQINSQGKFVFGFAREAALKHTLTWTLADGSEHQREITLSKRDYQIQRIDGLKPSMVSPPSSVLKRIRDDSVRVANARAGVRDFDGVFTGFIWPAEGPITGVYGSQRVLNGTPKTPHYGVDVGAPTGTSVVSPAPGKVTLASDLYYSGNTIIVDHGMGAFSTFLHLNSMAVSVGDELSQGQKIGEIGATGRATGPHLDWRLNLGKMRLDPALLVPRR
ncbi:M23 family metallopeptidase [Aestuariibacter sp. A3R04]|uniref:M23 family metallopeptidase n=1 Tax=Aestuariibacter sp. A3R04 TaxID=2841571 RepID=UPI00352C80A6